jgi:hypothetical protein
MIRDRDLVRQLLFSLERTPDNVTGIEDLDISGFDEALLRYHFKLIQDAGFIDCEDTLKDSLAAPPAYGSQAHGMLQLQNQQLQGRGRFYYRLTWEGHDFLDSVRDPKIWERTKNGIDVAGGFTFDLLKDLAKGFVKKQIEERTGIKLG